MSFTKFIIKKIKLIVYLFIFIFGFNFAFAENKNIVASINTNLGEIKIELNQTKAPKTVENFIKYIKAGFYNKTIFHRVIDNFMIQGGGFDINFKEKQTLFSPIINEADNGLSNDIGTIAMARTNDPNSASAQFFINVNNNDFLNFKSKSIEGWGYTVFGKVISGMDVVNKIKITPTKSLYPYQDVPVNNIIINSVTIE